MSERHNVLFADETGGVILFTKSHFNDPRISGDEEGFVVGGEGAVGGDLLGFDFAEYFALAVEDPDAAGAGSEEVALVVELHAVGEALLGFGEGCGVVKDAGVGYRVVFAEVEGIPDRAVGIGVGNQ